MTCPPFIVRRSQLAFTLIELLVVVAIIGLLAALLLPAISSMKMRALEAKSFSNLRQTAMFFNLYATDNNGLYPVDTTPPYAETLYPYAVPGGTVTDTDPALNAKISKTPFVSPGMTMAILKENNLQNYVGGQYVLRQVYGYNGNLDEAMGGGIGGQPRPARARFPAHTCLLMSTYGPRADFSLGGSLLTIGAEAYDGDLQIAFIDGHVETWPLANVPKDANVGADRLFWKGFTNN